MTEVLKRCTICNIEKPLSKFTKNKTKLLCVASECKLCKAKKDKEFYRKHRHIIREKQQEYYLANSEIIKKKVAEWQLDNRDKCNYNNRTYASKNKAKQLERSKFRQINKLQRTPKWLTKEDRKKIQWFYEEARRLRDTTGLHYHVDHIIPLQGKNVSGLHVPSNLQILLAKDNMNKSNKFVI